MDNTDFAALTGSPEGCDTILNQEDVVKILVESLDAKNETIKRTACLALVNLSATEKGAHCLINAGNSVKKVQILTRFVFKYFF